MFRGGHRIAKIIERIICLAAHIRVPIFSLRFINRILQFTFLFSVIDMNTTATETKYFYHVEINKP